MIYKIFTFLNSAAIEGLYAQRLEDRLSDVMNPGSSTGEGAMRDFIQDILNFAVPLGVFIAFVLLAYAAFIMVTSAGNPEKLNDAREVATNAIIGAVMIAMGVIVLVVLAEELQIPGLNY